MSALKGFIRGVGSAAQMLSLFLSLRRMVPLPLAVCTALLSCSSAASDSPLVDVSVRRLCGASSSQLTYATAKAPLLELRVGIDRPRGDTEECTPDVVVARAPASGLDMRVAGLNLRAPLDQAALDRAFATDNKSANGCWETRVCDDTNGDGTCRDEPTIGMTSGVVWGLGSLPPLRVELRPTNRAAEPPLCDVTK
jgi:hypothetical protein